MSRPGPEDDAVAALAHADTTDPAGDAADQAERLTMLMETEAINEAINEAIDEAIDEALSSGRPEPDVPAYPLQDMEEVLAEEEAEDGSDDPLHAGGLTPARWVSAEVSAMHVIEPTPGQDAWWPSDETDAERADPFRDQFDGSQEELTAEDQTLLGIDPYE